MGLLTQTLSAFQLDGNRSSSIDPVGQAGDMAPSSHGSREAPGMTGGLHFHNALSEANTILIIDDDEINRGILGNLFSAYYKIQEAENGRDGLRIIQESRKNLCAILLDVMMPEMDGLEALRHLKRDGLLAEVPVFLITAEVTDAVMREAYQLGVMDVIGQQDELIQQANRIIQLNQGMIEALSTAIEFRSEESGDHVRRIHDITRHVLQHTKWGDGMPADSIEQIALASIMHDVGKIAIPDAILNKPGRLTPEEFEIMKTHTTAGARLLEQIPQLRENGAYYYARDIALHHHEKWDGSGYPDGLKGGEITPWAQVVSLADVYDALSCKRVYKDALPRDKVLEMIRTGQCGVFNPDLLQCFFEVEPQLAQLYKKADK